MVLLVINISVINQLKCAKHFANHLFLIKMICFTREGGDREGFFRSKYRIPVSLMLRN